MNFENELSASGVLWQAIKRWMPLPEAQSTLEHSSSNSDAFAAFVE